METRTIEGSELTLPPHMNSLDQSVMDLLGLDRSNRVIACGVNPDDGFLYMVTGGLEVRFIAPNGTMVPLEAYPVGGGKAIAVAFEDQEEFRVIDAARALESSESVTDGASLFVGDTYIGDFEASVLEAGGQRDEDPAERA
jgi:hypothetical protein